jgi:hypothetical protein
MSRNLYTVVLAFVDVEGNTLCWLTYLKEIEYGLLAAEVDSYNEWIKILEKGFAPLSSYKDKTDADQLLIAKNVRYQDILLRPVSRHLYEKWSYYFELCNLSDPKTELEYELLEAYNESNLAVENVQELIDILTDPYTNTSVFSMGYRILPMIQKIIKEDRFYRLTSK